MNVNVLFAGPAFGDEIAPHQAHQSPADRKPQARSAVAPGGRAVNLGKRFEQARELLRGDSDAGVSDREPQHGAVLTDLGGFDPRLDLSRVGEFRRVAQEVQEHLLEPHRIAAEFPRHTAFRREENLDSLDSGSHADHVRELGQKLVQVEFLLLYGKPSGFDPGEIEDVLDDFDEVTARRANLLEVVALFDFPSVAKGESRQTENRVERRANFVAHVRQELALGLIGRFRLLLGMPELFFEQALCRHVARDAIVRGDPALLVEDGDFGELQAVADPAVVGQIDFESSLSDGAAPGRIGEPFAELEEELRRGESENVLDRIADENRGAGRPFSVDEIGAQTVDETFISLFLTPQRALGAMAGERLPLEVAQDHREDSPEYDEKNLDRRGDPGKAAPDVLPQPLEEPVAHPEMRQRQKLLRGGVVNFDVGRKSWTDDAGIAFVEIE